jgi:hypothetical protein
VALKRILSAQEKRILETIAAHPMLLLSELALVSQESQWRVRAALGQLAKLKLVKPVSRGDETRFVLAEVGVAYLAAVAGFGRAARRYAVARGWKRGLGSVIRHWEHTEAENEFFLQFAEVAKTRGARLVWHSELECRLYYEARGRRRSFLPDGEGVYQDKHGWIHFALEIDRGNASTHKLRAKLSQYYAYVESHLFRSSGSEDFRLFVVSKSWERAKTLRRIALELAHQFSVARLPMWITTSELLQAKGVDQAIWRKIDRWERCHCIESWKDTTSKARRNAC